MADQRQTQASTVAPTNNSVPAHTQIALPGPADTELEPEQRRVPLVAAHPDDAEFSSAGTVANWVRNGIDVVFVVVTSGDKGTPDRDMTNARLSSLREDEQREAAARVGVTNVNFLRFPDGELLPNLDVRGAITRMIRMYKPYVVMTHDPLTLF
jgi:LmbE family N-acetylglucosaminyl deacetylase